MARYVFTLKEKVNRTFWQICTRIVVVFRPWAEEPQHRGEEKRESRTSARRKYANKNANVFGSFLYCFNEIQIYLKVRETEDEKCERGPVSSQL
jgi:hypothetical protein